MRIVVPSVFLLVFPAGCRGDRPGNPEPITVGEVPRIWIDRDVPRTIDLSPYISAPGARLEVEPSGTVSATVDGLRVTLDPTAGFTGDVELPFVVEHGGATGAGVIPVRVKDGTRPCATTFRYEGPAGTVSIAGEWNAFSTSADPLVEVAPDEWAIDLVLLPGDYGYKLVLDGSTWLLDPANPLTTWVDGVENSRARSPDCGTPRFDLFDFAATPTGFSGAVTFVAAADGAPIAAPPSVTLDGLAWTGVWDPETRVLAFDEDTLAPGKHVLELAATDADGRPAERMRIPFWVESAPFEWRDAVAYFVLTDRFRNGNAVNDAPAPDVETPANWQGGDWVGLLDAVEEGYFDALGVNVLWISPHVDNPDGGWSGADGRSYAGYHGYWPKQPRATEEHFGSIEELRAVVDAAHARGIRVILDLVVNHVHEESPYWTANPGAPWFHDLYVCGYEQPIDCWFADYLPDLDFRHRPVLDQQVGDAAFWVEATGADGFRVDALKHFEHVVGRTLRADVAALEERGGSRFYMVGETFVGTWADGGQAQLVEYVSTRELDGQFDFPLYWELVRTIARGEGSLHDLEAMLSASQGYYPPHAVMGTFLGNHDVPRFVSHANGDIDDLFGNGAKEQGWSTPPAQPQSTEPYDRLKTAFTILFALPGMPTVYYGDEIGLAGAGDPDNRRAMPWTGLTAEQESVRAHLAKLAAARRDHPELARGTLREVWIENDLLVLERRWNDGDSVRYAYLAVNRAATSRTVTPTVAAEEGASFVDVVGGAYASVTGGALSMTLPPRGSALYVTTP